MREWQDSYHTAVAIPCGLTRLGPARRRLTREEWKAEQVQAKALKLAVECAAAVQVKGREYIDRTKANANTIMEDAAKVRAASDRLTGFGGAIRSVVDGLQNSRIRDQIRKDFARDLAEAKATADAARADAAEERTSRREIEKKVANFRHAARQQAQRLAATRQEIRQLSKALAAALDEPQPTPGGIMP